MTQVVQIVKKQRFCVSGSHVLRNLKPNLESSLYVLWESSGGIEEFLSKRFGRNLRS